MNISFLLNSTVAPSPNSTHGPSQMDFGASRRQESQKQCNDALRDNVRISKKQCTQHAQKTIDLGNHYQAKESSLIIRDNCYWMLNGQRSFARQEGITPDLSIGEDDISAHQQFIEEARNEPDEQCSDLNCRTAQRLWGLANEDLSKIRATHGADETLQYLIQAHDILSTILSFSRHDVIKMAAHDSAYKALQCLIERREFFSSIWKFSPRDLVRIVDNDGAHRVLTALAEHRDALQDLWRFSHDDIVTIASSNGASKTLGFLVDNQELLCGIWKFSNADLVKMATYEGVYKTLRCCIENQARLRNVWSFHKNDILKIALYDGANQTLQYLIQQHLSLTESWKFSKNDVLALACRHSAKPMLMFLVQHRKMLLANKYRKTTNDILQIALSRGGFKRLKDLLKLS